MLLTTAESEMNSTKKQDSVKQGLWITFTQDPFFPQLVFFFNSDRFSLSLFIPRPINARNRFTDLSIQSPLKISVVGILKDVYFWSSLSNIPQ